MPRKTTVASLVVTLALCVAVDAPAQERFTDDFESDLDGWQLIGGHAIDIIDSNDPAHGRVMRLQPDGAVFALIKDSDRWGGLSIRGEMLFPDDAGNYLGIIYNYIASDSRTDFGSLYIKGNGSYIRANPWRDGNVSRLLYEEYKTPIAGDDAIRIGKWHSFKAEIIANEIHLYVGDMATPKLTFPMYEHKSGLAGFGPRIVGYPVWIDNIEVSSIDSFSYAGPDIPSITYKPDALLTDWEIIGPLARPVVEIERAGDADQTRIKAKGGAHSWRAFNTDPRGGVITGRVTEYEGTRPVAYFRTTIQSETKRTAVLHISATDELAMFVNGSFWGFVYRDGYVSGDNDWNAWYDFWNNPDHAGSREEIELAAGVNQIVFRVRNGQFASGGFFARLEPE